MSSFFCAHSCSLLRLREFSSEPTRIRLIQCRDVFVRFSKIISSAKNRDKRMKGVSREPTTSRKKRRKRKKEHPMREKEEREQWRTRLCLLFASSQKKKQANFSPCGPLLIEQNVPEQRGLCFLSSGTVETRNEGTVDRKRGTPDWIFFVSPKREKKRQQTVLKKTRKKKFFFLSFFCSFLFFP